MYHVIGSHGSVDVGVVVGELAVVLPHAAIAWAETTVAEAGFAHLVGKTVASLLRFFRDKPHVPANCISVGLPLCVVVVAVPEDMFSCGPGSIAARVVTFVGCD